MYKRTFFARLVGRLILNEKPDRSSGKDSLAVKKHAYSCLKEVSMLLSLFPTRTYAICESAAKATSELKAQCICDSSTVPSPTCVVPLLGEYRMQYHLGTQKHRLDFGQIFHSML